MSHTHRHTRLFVAFACALFCSTALAQSSADALEPVGKIDLVGGTVSIVQAGKQPRYAVVGDAVNQGDILITGKDSEAHVTMQDSGFIALRPNTRIQIDSYKADGGDQDNGVFRLFAGGLRSITGWIGKYNRKSYTIRTPTATIGIRGTDHETRYIPPGSTEGEPGTYDKVFIGETSIQTDAGQTNVEPDHAGFVPPAADQQPRVLGRIPGFFRPGPHEDLINQKHAEIQKMIEQRREERRKVVAEKLAALRAAQAELKAQQEKNKAADAERKAAAEEQQQDSEAQLAALREKSEALQIKQKSLSDLHKAVQQKIMGALARDESLRDQFKAVGATSKQLRSGYLEIQVGRRALFEQNTAATDARKAAADAQRKSTEEQLAALNERGKALRDKQKAVEAMRQQIQQKSAAGAAKPADLNQLRKAMRDASDAADQELKDIQDAQNTLFESNIAATEARMTEAAQQRRQTDDQYAALNEKEDALQARQRDNEDKYQATQESAARELGKAKDLRQSFNAIHDGIEATRQQRQEIQDARRALRQKNRAAEETRQQAIMDQLTALRQTHRDMREKSVDFQQERESMQEEIRTLYEQEQKRYREELKADRQRRDMHAAQDESPQDN